MPYIDLGAAQVDKSGHTFKTSTWRETFDVPQALLDSIQQPNARKLLAHSAPVNQAQAN